MQISVTIDFFILAFAGLEPLERARRLSIDKFSDHLEKGPAEVELGKKESITGGMQAGKVPTEAFVRNDESATENSATLGPGPKLESDSAPLS